MPEAEQDGQGQQAEEYPDRLARRCSKQRTSNYARDKGDSPYAEQMRRSCLSGMFMMLSVLVRH
ncbi:hypothetical protein [Arthrobacter bambusae]|uniref:hypothetical protein n=1 Tax=Arthrobacter bambusae TaxID=1338426 RepID=UPI00277E8FC4|nr:hypothetical protein [Arthrobacter bambusae]MDQ0029347.1 hypothetical protein [Arthrobacter bambusae]MDQ0098256.1 hypothetical protein [Arthrobacter bambusae]